MPGESLDPNSWARTAPSNAFWFGANQIAPNLASLLRQQPAPYFPDPNTPNAQGKLPDSASWDRIDPRFLSAFGEAAQQGVNMVGPPMKAAAAAVPLVAAIARRGVMPAAEEAAAAAKGILAYHGSPHDFEKFDLSKIGTGEGAQAYGHGLYFAENEGVARSYRDALNPSKKYLPQAVAKELQAGTPHDQIWSKLSADPLLRSRTPQEINNAIEYVKNNPDLRPGKMYEVNINAKPEQFLDWDKPLAHQPEGLRQLATDQSKLKQFYNLAPEARGDVAYQALGGGSRATDALREAGIPGIKYLDQGSRVHNTAGYARDLDMAEQMLTEAHRVGDPRLVADAETKIAAAKAQLYPNQTSNYVVFNDQLIDILRKYGLAGLIAGGAAADSLPIPQQQPPVFSQ